METKKNISEKNKELFEKMHNGDEAAREELLKLNTNLVRYVLKRIYMPKWYYTIDDCFEAGQFGLLKAIDSFDPTMNISFPTYAAKCITNEVLMLYRSTRKLENNDSFESPVDIPKAGKSTFEDGDSLENLLEDKSSVNRIQENLEAEDLINKIKYVARCVLTPLEQKVFLSTCLNKNFKSQRKISSSLGISQSGISRLQKRAKDKIKNAFVNDGVFKGGASKFKNGASYLLPTKEMYAQMLRRNAVMQKNTLELLKRYTEDDKQAFVDIFIKKNCSDKLLAHKLMLAFDDYDIYKDKLFSSIYETYCKFLLGEVSFDEKNQPISARESLIGAFKRIPYKIENKNFVEQVQQNEEFRAFIKSYLPGMSSSLSRVLALKCLTTPSLTNSEIAEQLNLKESSVKEKLNIAMREIRSAYQNEGKPAATVSTHAKDKSFIEKMQRDEEVQAFVKSYLPGLLPYLAKTFVLKYFTTPSLTNSEIAEQLDTTEPTVKKNICVATKKIRTAYQNREKPAVISSPQAKNRSFIEQMRQDDKVQAFVKSYLPGMRPYLAKVFTLKYLTTPSLTNSEIAQQLNINEQTVQKSICIAIKEIRSAYQNGGEPGVAASAQAKNRKFIDQMQHDEEVQAFVKSYLPTMSLFPSSAFTLKYLTTPSLTNSEIAKQLNKKESSTRVAIQVALKEIRTAYQNGLKPGKMTSPKTKNRSFIEQMRQDEKVQAFVKSYLPGMRPCLAKAFTLKYFTTPSLTNSEIAQQLNITKHSVQTCIYLASKEIRTAYEKEKD